MRTLLKSGIFIFLLIATPTQTHSISLSNITESELWHQEEFKKIAFCTGLIVIVAYLYNKYYKPTPEPLEFTFSTEDTHEKKDETNPKAPVEVDVIVEDSDFSEADDTECDNNTDRKYRTKTTLESPSNFIEHPLYSQIADFTW